MQKKVKAKIRTIGVYQEDYKFFAELAEKRDFSKIRFFRYIMRRIKEQQIVI